MHLLSCENPQRVFNKYLGEYIWVPCGKCNICRNKRAAKYTNLLERERSQHLISFFVTLTYADEHIPFISCNGFDYKSFNYRNVSLVGSRSRDNICIPFSELFDMSLYKSDFHFSDLRFFYEYMEGNQGMIPYASKSDVQLFLKRLNKYIHDNVTYQYKNFRYFLVSEYGSTTFRPHFHAIFFVDNNELAGKFSDCISACWKFGIVDCEPVESSACAYVAQYINKSSDLPYVYQNVLLRPFFLCSRNPFIGAFTQCPEIDKEIVYNSSVETFARRKSSDIQLSNVPLESSYQNRLFPKCPCYGSLSDSMRVRFYRAVEQFSQTSLKSFLNDVYVFVTSPCTSEFCDFLKHKLKFDYLKNRVFRFDGSNGWCLFDDYSFNFLRRMYYVSRKVARQACQFGLSIIAYIQKILDYYDKKQLYMVNKMFELQASVAGSESSDCLGVLYPEYLRDCGMSMADFVSSVSSSVIDSQIADAAFFAGFNKKTHFKNAYLDSLALKCETVWLFNLINHYLYGKKCYETIEAIAPSCSQ